MSSRDDGYWETPVLSAQAANNIGIEELYQEVEKHQSFLGSSGKLAEQRQQQRREEFFNAVEQRLKDRVSRFMANNDRLASLLEEVERGDVDPYSAVDVMEKEAVDKGLIRR